MRVQVTIPVTVYVDYDTDEIGTINGEFLAQDTAKVVAGMILDLTDDQLVDREQLPLVEALTESTGWLITVSYTHLTLPTTPYV